MRWFVSLQQADEAVFYWLFARLKRPTRSMLARWVSRSGDGYGYLAAAMLAYVLGDSDAFLLTSLLLLGFALELPVYWVLKNTLRRPRPYQRNSRFKALIIAHDTFSFPSGHTTAAFMFAGLCAAIMPTWAVIVYAWAAAIGLSRIALGVHYPTDILAGAALGSSLAWLVLQLGVPWL
ncbi:MAG: phosphatase PAP2 family protein [Idiomarina sp.]|nr:phosphatase PAP2 family protein [Idiomarina sp.]